MSAKFSFIWTHFVLQVQAIRKMIEDLDFQVAENTEQEVAVCRIRIKGMACTSCSESVEQALSMVKGVKKAVVGLALEEAKIHFDPNITDSVQLIKVIEDAGFGTELISSGDDVNKVHLRIEGIRSIEDARIIQTSLEGLEGVNSVEMDAVGHRVTVTYDSDLAGPRSIIQCIHEAGRSPNLYDAFLYTPKRRETERQHEVHSYRNQFLWSCLFSVPVFLFSMVLPMVHPFGNWLSTRIYNELTVGLLLRWVLCSPVQFIIGWRYTWIFDTCYRYPFFPFKTLKFFHLAALPHFHLRLCGIKSILVRYRCDFEFVMTLVIIHVMQS